MKDGVRTWRIAALTVVGLGVWVGMVAATGRDEVRSGHRYHVKERETECITCHTSIERSQTAQERNIPGHNVCFECHDGEAAPNHCNICHTNPDEGEIGAAPQREILFSHRAHLEWGMTCGACHREANPEAKEELVYSLPGRETCFACHNGQRARLACESCHTQLASRLPKDHQPGWTQRHAEVVKADLSTCGQCHVQEGDCDLCHRGDNLPGIPHEEGFITSHPLTFYSKTKDCAACHDFQVSCVSCHRSRYVYPANHSLSNWREEHRGFAATDMESCAACHDEAQPTCMRSGCHG